MLDLLKKYRNLLVLGLLLLGSLVFYSANLRQKEVPSAFESRMLSLLSPLQQASQLMQSGIGSVWNQLFGASAATTAQLRSENQKLKTDLIAAAELRKENERLRKLLAFTLQLETPPVAARVIGVDASSWFRTITIDRGGNDGLKEGMAVITDHGVAGRIIACSAQASRVLLLVDTSSRLSTLVERTRTRGICRGTGDALILDYVPLNDDIQEGDILITSGLGGGFPKGLVIGTISNVTRRGFDMFQTIQVAPAIDFAHLEEVLVITTRQPGEGGNPTTTTPARP